MQCNTAVLLTSGATVDGLKLFSKELVLPSYVNGYIYLYAPVLALALALMG